MGKIELYIEHHAFNKVDNFPYGWYKFVLPITYKKYPFRKKNEVKFNIISMQELSCYKKLFNNFERYSDTFIFSESLNLCDYGYIKCTGSTITFNPIKRDYLFNIHADFEYDFTNFR